MKIVITGACGFIGSHIAEFYAKQGHDVIGIDNFSRFRLFDNDRMMEYEMHRTEIDLTKKYPNITIYRMDLKDFRNIYSFFKSNPNIDVVFHAAAQTAVTTSIKNPKQDFENNIVASFNLLEAIRESDQKPTLIYCSTNKVYGNNINNCLLIEKDSRYEYRLLDGIRETFNIDLTSHSPYGCSKLASDLYFQEYGYQYGFRVGVFRMSCIYGIRQMGCEDQGWIFHFINSALQDKTINIFGDGKQVRDVLYITDLIDAFDTFIFRYDKSNVFNIGGGSENTLSLLELIEILEIKLFKKIRYEFHDWRFSDQKVYISDISKTQRELGFIPQISPIKGIDTIIKYIKSNL